MRIMIPREMKEIGSEFHISEYPSRLISERDGDYVLSGRTAIDSIINRASQYRKVRHVYMPAYGCESMIAPFLRNNVEIEQYDMHLGEKGLEYHIDLDKQTDILYVNNYFGYENNLPLEVVRSFKEKGAIILYDRTHSLLMHDEEMQQLADYTFCGIRKWMGLVTGAFITDNTGWHFESALGTVDYWQEKADAMCAKARYLNGDASIEKQTFLDAFARFGHNLTLDYADKAMDDLSYTIWKQADLDLMRNQRHANAKVLHENVKGVRFIGSLSEGSSPLFVPVFFETKEKRDMVRRQMIQESIYCPVHWPKNSLVKEGMAANDLFDTELSLICDQRYVEEDMLRIQEIINKFNK